MPIINPKQNKVCVICKRWQGDANLKFRSAAIGFEYENVNGKCMIKNCARYAYLNANSCKDFAFCVEAEKLV